MKSEEVSTREPARFSFSANEISAHALTWPPEPRVQARSMAALRLLGLCRLLRFFLRHGAIRILGDGFLFGLDGPILFDFDVFGFGNLALASCQQKRSSENCDSR